MNFKFSKILQDRKHKLIKDNLYHQFENSKFSKGINHKNLLFNLFIFLFSFLLYNSSYSQNHQFNRATYYSYGTRLFSEAHVLPDKSPDSINVMILYKVVNEALVFIQVNPLSNPGNFQAVASVEIFFRNGNGIIKNRTLLTDTVWAENYDDTKSKEIYFQGFAEIKLAISDYSCTVQVLDRFKKPADKNEMSLNKNFKFYDKPVISDPIFVQTPQKSSSNKFIPFILGNNINFTTNDAKIIIPVSYKKQYNVFNYTIEKKTLKEAKFWNDSISISGRVFPSENSYLSVNKIDDEPLFLSINSGLSNNTVNEFDLITGLITIDLPSAQLSPGSYNLKIGLEGNSNDTANYNFDVIWVDMPLAMRNPSYAVEVMYYILNDEDYEKMQSGSDEEKAKKVMDYWKLKDPTNSTPYNEAMTEYFRRVDYAFFNFQTLRDKDGAKTERGKIYILNGKPDNIEKKLIDNKQYEIWTYNKLKKIFHFELVSNGLYNLKKIDEIN